MPVTSTDEPPFRFTRSGQLAVPEAMRPVLAQMARDAIAYHDGGECPYPEHLFMVQQYERFLDGVDPAALDGPPALAAVPPS